jgi:hypothetical protein
MPMPSNMLERVLAVWVSHVHHTYIYSVSISLARSIPASTLLLYQYRSKKPVKPLNPGFTFTRLYMHALSIYIYRRPVSWRSRSDRPTSLCISAHACIMCYSELKTGNDQLRQARNIYNNGTIPLQNMYAPCIFVPPTLIESCSCSTNR